MNVLVACEESQRVCTAFREKGHNAFSCDIIDCSGGHPEWHIQGDARAVANGRCSFLTQDGTHHSIDGKWDLIIVHPPCTRLCNSGQRWLYWGSEEYRANKKKEQEEAIEFFMFWTTVDCDRIALENPMGIMSTLYRQPDFTYNPYDFEGETECKKTGIWIVGDLPKLKPTRNTPLPKEERTQGIWKAHFGDKKLAWNSPETARLRSQTPKGVAKAMAEQWGGILMNTEQLIHDLKQLGKYSRLEPNWLRLAADKIEELSGRVEVVRCEKCEYCKVSYPAKEIGKEAIEGYFCNLFQKYMLPTDFCSYGERKESV